MDNLEPYREELEGAHDYVHDFYQQEKDILWDRVERERDMYDEEKD